MILQVHDELIFDVPGDELEAVRKIVTDEMTSAMKLDVPLTVECSAGDNWFEAK
jgi:DNA polymerase-1